MMTKTTSYLDWIKALPKEDSMYASCKCPECGSVGLEYQYFGFHDNRVGWKLVWCNTCKTGIQISRASLPERAKVLVEENVQMDFMGSHSDIKLIA